MFKKRIRRLFSALLCGGLLATSIIPMNGMNKVSAEELAADNEWGTVSAILDSYPGVYTENTQLGSPWDTRHSPDGPLMGNGTVYAFLAGDHKEQNFYISHSNMWQDRESNNGQEYTTFGGITIKAKDSVSDKKQDFRYEQDMKNAEVTAQSEDGFTTNSWLSAKENIIVTEIQNVTDDEIPIEISTWTANANTNVEVQDDIMIATKQGISNAKPERPSGTGTWEGWTVNIAMASRIIDDVEKDVKSDETKNTTELMLGKGQTVTLISAIEGGKEESGKNTMEQAVNKAKAELDTKGTVESLNAAKEQHRIYWKDYWLKSYIDIQDEKIERMYYGMMYQLGCSTSVSSENNGGVAAGLFPWTAVDHPDWQGDYTTNTDFQRQIHPLVTANRTEGIENYINIVEQYWPEAQRRAENKEHLNWVIKGSGRPEKFEEGIEGGALFPTHIGPWGASTEQWDSSRDYFNSPADATSVMMPIIKLWKYTMDEELLNKIYPMMKSVSIFWENYVTLEDGKYVVYGATHEGVAGRNPILDIDACKYMLNNTILAANELGKDQDKVQVWQNIIDNMSPVPTFQYNGKETICDIEGRTQDNTGHTFDSNPVTIQSVYYFDSIGMTAPDDEKEKYINYLDVKNGLGNHRRLISATRLGYDIHEIMDQLKAGSIDPQPGEWEGMRGNNTIGDIGVTARTAIVQDSLLQSNEGFINIFANWYDDQETSFRRLRAENAFLVDADMSNVGQVTYANIHSEKGRTCSVLNPWQGENVGMEVYKDGQKVEAEITATNRLGDVYTFETEAGADYELRPSAELPGVVNIKQEEAELFIQDTLQLEINTNIEKIAWKIDNEEIATVKDGVVIPKKVGDVIVTAYEEGNEAVSDTCTVHVTDMKKIPSDELSAVADSEEGQGGDGPASDAVDGNEATKWHSGYSDGKVAPDIPNNLNNTITIDLGKVVSVAKLEYVPRQDGQENGRILQYEIWGSEESEGDNFTKISEGTWDNTADKKSVESEPVSARRIKVRAMSTAPDDKHISAAEFYIYQKAEEKGNITKILTQIAPIVVAEGTLWEDIENQLPNKVEVELSTGMSTALSVEWNSDSYTGNSCTVTGELMTGGGVENPDKIQAKAEIQVQKADRNLLQSLYDQWVEKEQGLYTNTSWKVLQDALNGAKVILDNADADAGEIINATNQLQTAIDGLQEVEGVEITEEEVTAYVGIPKALDIRSKVEAHLVWESEDEEIATVDDKGVITPLKKGTTAITVRAEGTEYEDTCEVTVLGNEKNHMMDESLTFASSGYHENFIPENVADGKTEGEGSHKDAYAWVSPNVPIDQPRWITVEFPEPVTINKWRVTHVDTDGNGGSITKDFELQISENGQDWIPADTVKDNTELVTERYFAEYEKTSPDDSKEITSKYFRLYITAADNYNGQWPNNMARIDEWELLYEYGNYYVEFQPGETEGDSYKQEIRYNEETSLEKNQFAKEGYLFDGWNDEKGNRYKDGQEVLNLTDKNGETIVLTARWKPIQYQIQYNLNQGEGKAPENMECTYDTEVALASTEGIMRDGYKIVGWNTKADGSGTDYKSGEVVSNLTAKDGDTVTLYAKWEKKGVEGNIDKSALKTIVEKADKIDVKLYTEESVKIFEKALKKAKELLADESLDAKDQEKVDAAVKELQEAMAALKLKDDGNTGDGDNGNSNVGDSESGNNGDSSISDNGNGIGGSNKENTQDNVDKAAKTGDTASVFLPIAGIGISMILTCIVGLYFLHRRKR